MRVVTIDTTVLSGGASPDSESLALLIVPDGQAADGAYVLAPTGADRFRRYSSSAAVAADFGAASEIAIAAGRYFSQPGGPSDLLIARWNKSVATARTYGGAPSFAPGGAAGKVAVDGADVNIPFVVGDNTESKVAARIQTALAASVAGTTVAYNATRKRYEINWGAGSPTIGAGAAGDVAVALGFDDSVAGFQAFAATAVGSIAAAASAMRGLNSGWRWVGMGYDATAAANTANAKALIAWASGQGITNVQAVTEGVGAGEAAAVDDDTVSRAAIAAASDNVACIVTKGADHKAMAAIGAVSGVNYAAADSVRTLALQTLVGCAVDVWTETELARLDAKRANYYIDEHGIGVLFPGVTTGATWEYVDTAAWVNWFRSALGLELFNETKRRRVPQSSAGIARLAGAIGRAAEVGVVNGGIAENTQLGTAATQTLRRLSGDPDATGLLPLGYAIFSGPLSQRRGRKTPPQYLLTRYTGAFHEVDLQLIVET